MFRSTKIVLMLIILFVCASLAGCGYNSLQSADEEIKGDWSEVLNQYQRRYDLVPNLVNTVKGLAQQELEVFTQVTEARAKVGAIQATPELIKDEAAFMKFQQAQSELNGSISKLIAVAENYPQIKSNEGYVALMSQLEGTENRLAVARNRYIQSVKKYNVLVRSFPSNLTAKFFNHTIKPTFALDNERAVTAAPKIDFNKQGQNQESSKSPAQGSAAINDNAVATVQAAIQNTPVTQ